MGNKAMGLKQFYDLRAPEGVVITGRIHKAAKLFQRHLQKPVGRLLDIGCGVGNIAIYLKEAMGAREVYGVEIAEKQVEVARERGVQAFAVDVGTEGLPFEDAFFDAVFCGEVIEHLVDTDHLLAEVYRILSLDGLCVLTTPNLAGWYNRLALLLGYLPFPASVSFKFGVGYPRILGHRVGGGHLRVFTYLALVQLLRAHSLRVVGATGATILEAAPPNHLEKILPALRALDIIDRGFSRFPNLSGHIIVAAKKA